MYMLKLLFQKLQIDKAHPGSRKNSRAPEALLKITAWGQVEASGLCVPGRDRRRQTTTCPCEQLAAQDRNVAVSFTWSSLNFKTPHCTLFIPCYKNLGLERKDKMVCSGMNPPSSQIAGHLNQAPINIQLLSLLIRFGSDRQPEHRCLFQFH